MCTVVNNFIPYYGLKPLLHPPYEKGVAKRFWGVKMTGGIIVERAGVKGMDNVRIRVPIRILIRMYTYVYVHVHIYVHVYIYVYVYVYVYGYVYGYLYGYVHVKV